jgi:hypothetical protein
MKRLALLCALLTFRAGWSALDRDGDGLLDAAEREPTSLTSPMLADSDGDGLLDGVEVQGRTNPLDADSDGDWLPDALEDANRNGRVDVGETNPRLADTDGDGLSDGEEDANRNGQLGPTETDPRRADSDGDGLTDAVESRADAGTDARHADSDRDGVADGVEDSNQNGRVDRGETNPRAEDSDGDGLPDGLEDANQNGRVDVGETNPLLADTDGDGVRDGVEDANRDGKQGPRESSPLVSDLHPTHRNDVLGVPEPLLVDWVRALGARAGEFELNALGVLQTDGRFELAPEVEWVPVDGLGLEVEAVVKNQGFDGLKLAGQLTLLSDARAGLGHGLQVVGRWQRGSNVVSLTALHLAQARLGARGSLGVMSGLEVGTDGRLAFAVHPTVGVRLHERVSLVLEANGRAGPFGVEGALVPHLRADLPHLGSVQLGAGPSVVLVHGVTTVTGLVALRLTWER